MTVNKKIQQSFPSREQIKNFIQEASRPVGKREIARVFNIRGSKKIELKKLLKNLVADDEILPQPRRKLATKEKIPAVGVIKITKIDDDGESIGILTSESNFLNPTKIILPHNSKNPSFQVGDRVLARFSFLNEKVYKGAVIRRLKPTPAQFIGVLEKSGNRLVLTTTVQGKKRKNNFIVEDLCNAKEGDIVSAALDERDRFGLRRAKVLNVLGRANDPHSLTLISVKEHEIPTEFSPEALALAEKARLVRSGPKRRNLRDIEFITVDGPDARDFDDAVWATEDETGENPGGWRIVIAIADVAHYVRPNDDLDKEAKKRGNSVYFPDRVIPMLPEKLSNGVCSLNPNEDRACIAVEIHIDSKGTKLSHQFSRVVIKSRARVTYKELQLAFDKNSVSGRETSLSKIARSLFGAFYSLKKASLTRGTLEIDIKERQVNLNENTGEVSIQPRERLDSHRLIEEFMILANVAAAETLEQKKKPCVYRVHDAPKAEKLEDLRTNLEGVGIKIGRGQPITPKLFNKILRQTAGKQYGELVNQLVLRAQRQALYNPNNIGHFGLGLRRYAHFTSPIRRYSDLLVHRALISAHEFGVDGLNKLSSKELNWISEHISMTERRAVTAERSAIDKLTAFSLKNKLGTEFKGVVSGVMGFGLFVYIAEYAADTLLAVNNLPDDYYLHDKKHHTLTGKRTRQKFSLGDTISVIIKATDPISGRISVDYGENASKDNSVDLKLKRGHKKTRKYSR